jgi:pentatricopeptide repeat protein
MKLRKLLVPTLLTILMAHGPLQTGSSGVAHAQDEGTPLAVLMACSGPVTVHRSGGVKVKGTFGLPLQPGDEVKTGAGASAEVLFEAGHSLQIGANSNIQIKGQRGSTPAAPAGEPKTEKSFEVVQNFLKLKNSEGTSVVTGLRAGNKDQDLVAVSPSQTKVRNAHPTFQWEIADAATELRLTVYSDGGVHWQEDVSGAKSLAYPAGAPELSPGVSYSWTLETTDPMEFPPRRTQAAFFEVIAPAAVAALDESIHAIDADSKLSESSGHVIKASVYFNHGLLEDAIAETKSALEMDPDNASLQSILARLYAEAGRTKDAMATYNEMIKQ